MTRGDFSALCNILSTKFNFVVGICGMPGSGKTTLAKMLAEKFPDRTRVINADDFILFPTHQRKSYLQDTLDAKDQERLRYLVQPNDPADNPYADPRIWYDWPALAAVFSELKSGKSVERTDSWNQQTGLRDKTSRYDVPQSPETALYLLDSIYLFEPALAGAIDYKVIIGIDNKVAVGRAALRDSHRLDSDYQAYKDMVSETHCRSYLDKHRSSMDFILTPTMA